MALLLISISACGWVDSTGVQGTTVAVSLRNAQPVAIIEGTSLSAVLAGEGAELRNWSWNIDDSDAIERCDSIGDFDANLATSSLQDACSQAEDCRVTIEESVDDNNATRFTLTLPALRSPVALSYRLSATRDDGATLEREQFLCGLSVNEAPVANDDSYLALPNELLVVDASDANNLLANDSDDDDVRNSLLSVTAVTQPPAYASQFSFDDLGGFSYARAESAPISSEGYTEDRFVYTITDGLHETQATAVIRIMTGNTAPVQLQQIPDLSVEAASATSAPEAQQFDLSQYFFDADGNSLSFILVNDSLPASGNVTLDTGGRLQTLASLEDVGKYRLEVEISDGIDTLQDTFILEINEPATQFRNHTPDVTDIKNSKVEDTFSYDVSVYFSDIDDDPLTFSATGLPVGVCISARGVISGRASSLNRGKWLIRVNADDGRGGSVDDSFRLQIS